MELWMTSGVSNASDPGKTQARLHMRQMLQDLVPLEN